MIKNKFINTARSISFNLKNNKINEKNTKPPHIWFLTDVNKTNCPVKIIKKLPKRSGVIIRNYSKKKQIKLEEIKSYKHSRLLKILVAGNYPINGFLDGIHFPSWSRSKNIGNNFIKSIPVHSGKDLRKCITFKANIVFIAPVFNTSSHKNPKYLGVVKLGLLAKLFKVPVIALGGINEKNISRLKSLPISGCAAIDAFIKD